MGKKSDPCPDCNRTGVASSFLAVDGEAAKLARRPVSPCPRCEGRGEVDERYLTWMLQGAALRFERCYRSMSLQQMSVRTGLSVGELLGYELGYREAPVWLAEIYSEDT